MKKVLFSKDPNALLLSEVNVDTMLVGIQFDNGERGFVQKTQFDGGYVVAKLQTQPKNACLSNFSTLEQIVQKLSVVDVVVFEEATELGQWLLEEYDLREKAKNYKAEQPNRAE